MLDIIGIPIVIGFAVYGIYCLAEAAYHEMPSRKEVEHLNRVEALGQDVGRGDWYSVDEPPQFGDYIYDYDRDLIGAYIGSLDPAIKPAIKNDSIYIVREPFEETFYIMKAKRFTKIEFVPGKEIKL